jgi:hypothetical protein
LERVIEQYGLGKVKDRVRHAMLEHWASAFSDEERGLLSRLHAAALMKMLFDLPAEIYVTGDDKSTLHSLSEKQLTADHSKPRHVVKLQLNESGVSLLRTEIGRWTAHPQWLDVPKYSVRVVDRD